MSVIDPWGFDKANNEQGDLQSRETDNPSSFGDNFVDSNSTDKSLSISTCAKVIENNEPATVPFEPLPDSREYLDRLESKLRKLQKGSLQKALSERRLDEARRLLDARLISTENSWLSADNQPEAHIEESIEDNPILRRLCPERQAVNISELQKLLEGDKLQKLVDELGECEIQPEESQPNQNYLTEVDEKETSVPKVEKAEEKNISAAETEIDQKEEIEKLS